MRRCRDCGCIDQLACSHEDGHTCSWVEPDLCSACVPGATGWEHPDPIDTAHANGDPPPSQVYTALHLAYAATAREHQLVAMEVRVLVAVHECGDHATTHRLATLLHAEASSSRSGATAMRRAVGPLYAKEFLDGRAVNGGPRRPGVATKLALTSTGAAVVETFLATYHDLAGTILDLRVEQEAIA